VTLLGRNSFRKQPHSPQKQAAQGQQRLQRNKSERVFFSPHLKNKNYINIVTTTEKDRKSPVIYPS
jgi:hypothetical protein